MEKIARNKFEGVKNIILFNSKMFVLALVVIVLLFVAKNYFSSNFNWCFNLAILFVVIPILLSIIVSYYVYDVSDLYKMNWLSKLNIPENAVIANVSAGFDETSSLLHYKLKPKEILMFDFYDETTHTEPSIKLARKYYPPSTALMRIQTSNLPIANNKFDCIFLILAAHEIRNNEERVLFFSELKTKLKTNGKIVVIEHQRDLVNFIAYNIGFFHFLSNKTWLQTFKKANLKLLNRFSITPFIQAFILN